MNGSGTTGNSNSSDFRSATADKVKQRWAVITRVGCKQRPDRGGFRFAVGRFCHFTTAMKFWILPLLAGWLSLSAMAEEPALTATNFWSFELPDNGSECSPAIAADGTIYLGTFQGWLVALTPEGKPKWKFKAGREIKSSPAVATDGTIYFGSRDWNFYALAPDGKLKWTFNTGAWVDSSPAIGADGTVYFGSWDKNFYALNPDGSLKWKFATSNIVSTSPAIALDGTILFWFA